MPLKPIVRLKRLDARAKAPAYMSAGAAGADLHALLEDDAPRILPAGGRAIVRTGFAIGLPAGFEAQVRPRSGLAVKSGVTVLNSPGTIDEDYRGEICVIVINHSGEDFEIKHGDRIAQMVIVPVRQAVFTEVDHLDETDRGDAGFGSTGR